MNWRHWFSCSWSLAQLQGFLISAIPQDEGYHNFADKRALWGVPNTLD